MTGVSCFLSPLSLNSLTGCRTAEEGQAGLPASAGKPAATAPLWREALGSRRNGARRCGPLAEMHGVARSCHGISEGLVPCQRGGAFRGDTLAKLLDRIQAHKPPEASVETRRRASSSDNKRQVRRQRLKLPARSSRVVFRTHLTVQEHENES